MKFRITNADTAPVTAYLQRLSPDKEYDAHGIRIRRAKLHRRTLASGAGWRLSAKKPAQTVTKYMAN